MKECKETGFIGDCCRMMDECFRMQEVKLNLVTKLISDLRADIAVVQQTTTCPKRKQCVFLIEKRIRDLEKYKRRK